MAEKWRPYCGTVGADFIDHWCGNCRRDAKFRETEDGDDSCPIVRAALMHDLNHPNYPSEWVSDESGPRCTAFEPTGGIDG